LSVSATTQRLSDLGATVHIGHAGGHIASADAVVISSAVQPDNPEVIAARMRNIPVVPRAIMLAELLRLRQGIAIAGTHGKTTTTSLVASVLAQAEMDPTFVIGGKLEAAGSHAKLGSGEFIVIPNSCFRVSPINNCAKPCGVSSFCGSNTAASLSLRNFALLV